MSVHPVSILGVGNMGSGMAGNLLERGWPVHVLDVLPGRMEELERFGAVALANPAQAAIKSIATIVCVVDAAQTESVLFGDNGLVTAAQPGHTVLLCPTMSPGDVEGFASRLARHGIETVDAPMSGYVTRIDNIPLISTMAEALEALG